MVEHDSHETSNMYPNLSVPISDQQQFRLKKTNEIRNYFIAEIKERELMSKRLVNILLLFTILISH